MQKGERITNGQLQRHLVGGVIQLVSKEGGEDLPAALLLALLPRRLPFGAAGLIKVLESEE